MIAGAGIETGERVGDELVGGAGTSNFRPWCAAV
jgi:hypothetical protein